MPKQNSMGKLIYVTRLEGLDVAAEKEVVKI
jgi:hypothetical protein